MRSCAVAVLSAAALLAAASGAQASSVGTSGGTLVFTAEPGEQNEVTITLSGGDYVVTDLGATAVDASTGCVSTANPQTVSCPGAGITAISADLADGDDLLSADAPVPAAVLGGFGVDELTGGSGPDELLGGPDGDIVRGGGGNDRVLELDDERNVLEGGEGADFLQGGSGPDDVLGGPGDDELLFGGDGNDLIDGGEGDDILDSGHGPTPFLTDADRLVGGPGVDRASYERQVVPVAVTMSGGADDGVAGEGDDVAADVEVLLGGQGADELFGGPGPDTINGRAGGDVMDGGGGDDMLDAGAVDPSSDTLRGGTGVDLLEGHGGSDELEGGEGDDRLTGEAGADRLRGDGGADTVEGGAGDDELDGGLGADTMSGGEGTDTVVYGRRAGSIQVTIDGEDNDGEVLPTEDGLTRIEDGAVSREHDNVDESNERVTASQRDDAVSGDNTSNTLEGETGEDFLEGRGGADTLSGGGRGDSILSRDRAKDRVSCGAGFDYVVADRRDLVSRRRSGCEYVDDGSRTAPRARRDIAVDPSCRGDQDAEIAPPGAERGMAIDRRVLAPLRSTVDAVDCRLELAVGTGGGRVRTGTIGRASGPFEVTQQRRRGRLITRLRGTGCTSGASAAGRRAEASIARRKRHLRRMGRVGFPVETRVQAAIIRKGRGVATWTVDDRCGRGATITVTDGRLTVIDLGRDRTAVVLGPEDPPYRALTPRASTP